MFRTSKTRAGRTRACPSKQVRSAQGRCGVGRLPSYAPRIERLEDRRLLDSGAWGASALLERYAELPLGFEANQGQADPQVAYLARGTGYALFLTPGEAVLRLQQTGKPDTPGAGATLRMQLIDANPSPELFGLDGLPGQRNYLLGNDPAAWHTGIPTYSRIEYRGAYPGIDLVYHGSQRRLEYDFVVAPGADPSDIALGFQGAERLSLDPQGGLVLQLPGGDLVQEAPVLYQEIDNVRQAVSGGYVLEGGLQVGFQVGNYDLTRPLVIDPVLAYSTYLGGTEEDRGLDVAVDPAGNAYVIGTTDSTNFPTAAALQPGNAGGPAGGFPSDVFVSKLNATGTALIYSTYLGGGGVDEGASIAVNAAGHAYLTGSTRSDDFPTANALQPARAVAEDAFVVRLNAAGSGLLFATYLGGNGGDYGRAIAVDPAGQVYVTGQNFSLDFPTTAGVFGPPGPFGTTSDVFVTKLDPAGTTFVYSSMLTGGFDAGGIAADAAGNAYITGTADGIAGLATVHPFQPNPGSILDAFVAKVNPTGSALIYSTYLGGQDNDFADGIAVDAAGNAHVTGETRSTDFPTVNAFQGGNAGDYDVFVAKLNAAGSALLYSTYLGGSGDDNGQALVVDAAGNAHVTGYTSSQDFRTVNPIQATIGSQGGGLDDAFVARLNPAGSVVFSTYLGGQTDDRGQGIAVDAAGNTYITGWTDSPDFPTQAPLQPNAGNAIVTSDAFVTKIAAAPFDIVPNRGGDTGTVSVVIHGRDFVNGATARLTRTGQADIVANPVSARPGGLALDAVFNLIGRARGAWDVVVTNPNGTGVTLPGAFTIEEGRAGEIWVDIGGRDAIKGGVPQTITILYGNRGNVDSYGVPIWVGGIPGNAVWEPDFAVTPPPPLDGTAPYDWNEVGDRDILEPGGTRRRGYFTPSVPAGSTGVLKFKATVPQGTDFRLRTWANRPWIQQDPATPEDPALKQSIDCVMAMTGEVVNALGFIPNLTCRQQLALNIANQTISIVQAARADNPSLPEKFYSTYNIVLNAVGAVLGCLGKYPSVGQVINIIQVTLGLFDSIGACYPQVSESVAEASRDIFTSVPIDPNDKVGTLGAGAQHYVSSAEPLRYTVFFENLATATAPAQDVVITDHLNVANLELNTLSFGPISFGNRTIVPPPGLSDYTTDVDLRPDYNLILRITAKLDTGSGNLTWRFTSLDPATGQPTTEPLAGFLPPNTAPPQGEGSVFYTVMPRAGLATGTEFRNRARIVFDVNAPIDTPEWVNTIDNTAPTSQVLALPPATGASFTVQWGGTDAGAGMRDYTIYVSDNDGPFTVWLSNTAAVSATFSGQVGHRYGFYSTARDGTKNREATPAGADTVTTVGTYHQRLLAHFYRDLLGRDADAAGQAYFSYLLDSGQANRQQVAQAILASQEYRSRLVGELYRTVLRQEVDPASREFFTGMLAQGASREAVEALLFGSEAYFNGHGSDDAAFLVALFEDVLDRDPDLVEAALWAQALAEGTSRTEVAWAFLNGEEGRTRKIDQWYQQLLGRDADAAGQSGFLAALDQGARAEDVLAVLAGSTEYATLRVGDPNQLLVAQLYRDLLERPADDAGLAYFSGLLQAGASRLQVVQAIQASEEYRRLVVQKLYAALLGRPADEAGLAYFAGVLATGSVDRARELLLGSPEYFMRAGGTKDAFLSALYRDVLGRGADEVAMAWFRLQLEAGVPLGAVAAQVPASPEARQRLVRDAYERYLHRAADDAGLSFFTTALLQGSRPEDVVASLIGAPEYSSRL